MDLRWAFQGAVKEGTYCTMQAALKQLGNDGAAWVSIQDGRIHHFKFFFFRCLLFPCASFTWTMWDERVVLISFVGARSLRGTYPGWGGIHEATGTKRKRGHVNVTQMDLRIISLDSRTWTLHPSLPHDHDLRAFASSLHLAKSSGRRYTFLAICLGLHLAYVISQLADSNFFLFVQFTIAIAILTFVQVCHPTLLSPQNARRVVYCSIVFIFLFLFLMISIPSLTIDHYYGDTGLWCWIAGVNEESLRLRIGSEYAYFWLAALVSIGCYGWIVFRWLQEAGKEGDKLLMRDALAMGWYPAGT